MLVLVVYFLTTAWILTKLTLPGWCVFGTLALNALFVFLSLSAAAANNFRARRASGQSK